MADQFTSAGVTLFSGLLTGGIKLIIGLIVAGVIIGAFFWIRYLRQFDIEVEIKSLRAGSHGKPQYKILHDKAGYLYDRKNKMYYFKIRGMNIELVAPPFNVLIPTDKGNKIKLLQTSADEFTFLLEDDVNTEVIIGTDGKEYPISQVKTKQLEGDVAFWNMKRKSQNKDLFNPDSTIMKLLPYIVPVLMFVLVIFMTWIVVKNFSVLAGIAESLKQTAEILARSGAATVTTHSP